MSFPVSHCQVYDPSSTDTSFTIGWRNDTGCGWLFVCLSERLLMLFSANSSEWIGTWPNNNACLVWCCVNGALNLAPEGRSEKEKELGNEMAMAARLPALARSWAVAAAASPTTTTAYPPGCRSCSQSGDGEPWMLPVPVHIVTYFSQLPSSFLEPDPEQPIVIGFDCEGVSLARNGRLCIMQLAFEDAVYIVDAVQGGNALMQACKPAMESPYVTKVCHDCKRDSEALYFQYGIKLNNVFDTQIAYSLLGEQQGKAWVPDDYISFVDLLADERFCGVVYDEKEEVRGLLKKDPEFWTHRPWTEMMKRVAADDVRFLLRIHHCMVRLLPELSKWRLGVRSSLYCRCFCAGGHGFSDWPPLPSLPESLAVEEVPQEEVLAVVDVPYGKMGRIIGKKGSSILYIKQSCRADIFIGGARGPPDKIFVIGAMKEVRKAEAILRGRFL